MTNEATRTAVETPTNSIANSGWPSAIMRFRVWSASATEAIGRRLDDLVAAQPDLREEAWENIPLPIGLNLQLLVDVFNLYDKQTGFNYETRVVTIGTLARNPDGSCSGFRTGLGGELGCLREAPYPKSFYDPRRFQLALKLQF